MTLLSLEHIVGSDNYFIDDKTLQIWSFKYKKYTDGKLLTPLIKKDGYIQYRFRVNGKTKNIYFHHIIVKMFIKKDFNPKVEEVDHCDTNKLNNSIENLCVVSRSENCRNRSISTNGKKFNFVDNIGNYLVINEEAKIYYSLELDKFYMFINQTNKFKELHVYLHRGYPYVRYSYKNKQHNFSINKFKKNL